MHSLCCLFCFLLVVIVLFVTMFWTWSLFCSLSLSLYRVLCDAMFCSIAFCLWHQWLGNWTCVYGHRISCHYANLAPCAFQCDVVFVFPEGAALQSQKQRASQRIQALRCWPPSSRPLMRSCGIWSADRTGDVVICLLNAVVCRPGCVEGTVAAFLAVVWYCWKARVLNMSCSVLLC